MKNIRYTNFVLTVIACLLALNLVRTQVRTAHAQASSGQLAMHHIANADTTTENEANRALNNAVGDGELVSVFATAGNHIMVVVREKR